MAKVLQGSGLQLWELRGKWEGKKSNKSLTCEVWRPRKLGCPCSPTFLSFYYVLEPKVSGENDGKRDKNASYNRSSELKENWKKFKVVRG